MRVGYGIDVQPEDDPYIEIGERAVEAVSATAGAGMYLVDLIPICEHGEDIVHISESDVARIFFHSEAYTCVVPGCAVPEGCYSMEETC